MWIAGCGLEVGWWPALQLAHHVQDLTSGRQLQAFDRDNFRADGRFEVVMDCVAEPIDMGSAPAAGRDHADEQVIGGPLDELELVDAPDFLQRLHQRYGVFPPAVRQPEERPAFSLHAGQERRPAAARAPFYPERRLV